MASFRPLPPAYALRNLSVRSARTVLTVAVVALVVLAVTLMLALASGIRRTLVAAGLPDNLIVLRKGATNDGASMLPIEAYRAVRYFPGIAVDAAGEPLVSPETVLQPFFWKEDGGRENVLVRGVEPVAFAVHRNVRIAAGRAMRPSSGEVVVGRAVAERYPGARLGGDLRFGHRLWKVVGILEAGGSAFESEVWADVNDVWSDADRSVFTGLRLTVAPGADREALIRRIAADPRWALEARPELDYYREQGEQASFLYGLAVGLAVVMGVGASFGATNTMFAAVQSRTAEIGTLRALGFSRRAIQLSFVLEATGIALAGFVAGALLALVVTEALAVLVEGVAVNLATFTTASVRISPSLESLGFAFVVSLLLGLAGGWLPARRAARLSPVEALRRA